MSKEIQLTGKNAKIAYDMLRDVTKILKENNITYWLDFGTLLGAVRENRLLPWDNDLDISIREKDSQKLREILPQIKQIGYRTYERFVTNRYKEDLIQNDISFVKIRNNRFFFFRGRVALDIFILHGDSKNLYYEERGKKHFTPKELDMILEDFSKRERRFGGI